MRSKNYIYIYIAAAVIVVLLAGSWLLSKAVSPWAEDKFVEALEKRFASTVEIDSLDVQVFPTFRAVGTNMVFHHKGRTDVPPLFEISRFTATSSLPALLFGRVSLLELEGLRITVARDKGDDGGEDDRDAADSDAVDSGAGVAEAGDSNSRENPGDATAAPAGAEGSAKDSVEQDRSRPRTEDDAGGDDDDSGPGFVVSTVIADGTHLEILPKQRWKKPLSFDLFKLTLHGAGPNSAMKFDSVMTNPKPPGDIVTSGEFGPWDKESPRRTPVSGEYTFTNADLSVFKGISGILSSEGTYDGVLERITVEGWTDIPDFQASGNTVHLKTNYHAVVDGTSGDTYLEPVEASFLQSKVIARGKVAGVPDRKGKAVVLDVTVSEARVEDMVAIAVPLEGEPPLSGPIQFSTKFHLPPGDEDVVKKLELDGQFGVEESTFTSKVQDKVDGLSKRAQGKPEEQPTQEAKAEFDGEFQMANGTIKFPRVEFAIPGAAVKLSGGYALREKLLDFEGHLLMDAKVSETTTGVKSFFLKLADPFFRDKGKTSIPIKISGTVKKPDFGLAIGGAKKVDESGKKNNK
ncbi:MAG: hypothetical protein WD733_20550 [Bryobacterales bacterium]